MGLSYYEVLGVEADATPERIKASYLALSKVLHPDRHVGRPDDVVQALSVRMADLNEAWTCLSDPQKRADYDASLRGGIPRNPDLRPPVVGECLLCGTSPAKRITILEQSGRVIFRRTYRFEGTFCKGCGTALLRHATNRTLILGWWGVLSFFMNVIYLARDVHALQVMKLLPNYIATRAPEVVSPIPRPLDPGKPLWRRAGIWVGTGVVIIAIVAATNVVNANRNNTSGVAGITDDTTAGSASTLVSGYPIWSIGTCVATYNDSSGVQRIEPVSCQYAHYGTIVADESVQGECGYPEVEWWDSVDSFGYCVDTSQ